jgi:hypothetical protein
VLGGRNELAEGTGDAYLDLELVTTAAGIERSAVSLIEAADRSNRSFETFPFRK